MTVTPFHLPTFEYFLSADAQEEYEEEEEEEEEERCRGLKRKYPQQHHLEDSFRNRYEQNRRFEQVERYERYEREEREERYERKERYEIDQRNHGNQQRNHGNQHRNHGIQDRIHTRYPEYDIATQYQYPQPRYQQTHRPMYKGGYKR